jgi:hypothetical protein
MADLVCDADSRVGHRLSPAALAAAGGSARRLASE